MLSIEFLLAGKATFTVSNPSGLRYTYRVVRKDNESGPVWFVGMLTGADNENDYTYLGVLSGTGEFRLTRKSRLAESSTAVGVLKWSLIKIFSGRECPEGYKIQHAGRCGRCGRLLTVPESINSGIGPECAKKMARS